MMTTIACQINISTTAKKKRPAINGLLVSISPSLRSFQTMSLVMNSNFSPYSGHEAKFGNGISVENGHDDNHFLPNKYVHNNNNVVLKDRRRKSSRVQVPAMASKSLSPIREVSQFPTTAVTSQEHEMECSEDNNLMHSHEIKDPRRKSGRVNKAPSSIVPADLSNSKKPYENNTIGCTNSNCECALIASEM